MALPLHRSSKSIRAIHNERITSVLTRREVSKGFLAGSAALLAPNGLWPASNSSPQADNPQRSAERPQAQRNLKDLDLLIKGGTVIDPGQGLHALADVAVRDGKIAEVSQDISEQRARQVVSAKGAIVTPGFIDAHVHCYDGAAGAGTDADHYCLSRGVTTVVDAGSSSYQNIYNFRRYIIGSSLCRIHALINIDGTALSNLINRQQDPATVLSTMNVEQAAYAVRLNKPVTVGIKVLLGKTFQGDKDVEALTRAVAAAEASKTPLMAHIDNTTSPLPSLLNLMRKGDIYSHCYNSHQHGILDANGKILPEAQEARQRGVLFDPAHGLSHFSFDIAEKCLQQDFLPDTISTDMNSSDVHRLVFDLPTTVSKFLLLGMDLDKAIERVTSKPASIFDFNVNVGTFKPGYEADIGIFELQDGKFEFGDCDGKTRIGDKRLVCRSVVCRGELIDNRV
jgi:dihydroorotase